MGRRLLIGIAALACVAMFGSPAHAAPTITEFSAGNGPIGVTAGSDSNVWFADAPNPGAIGRITQSGTVTLFDETDGLTHDAGPEAITSGPGGLWFAERTKDKIGRITTSGAITEFPDGSHNEPLSITAGPDGNLWYTAKGSHGAIVRITPSGSLTEYTAGLTSDGNPRSITAGPDGNLWFTSPNKSRIGRITTAGVITEFPMLLLMGAPQSIVAGPDGNLWFTKTGLTPAIGRITPSGTITEFTSGLPIGTAPNGITAGADGNLYFTDSGTNKIGQITTTGAITMFGTGLTASAGLRDITSGGDGRLWFAEHDAAKIGRMTVAPATSGVSTSGVTDVAASLTGTVRPNSQATTYYVEWGQTTSYGQTTSASSAGSGGTAVPVQVDLSGLSPSTTYHARLVATNATGSTVGPDHTFATTAPGAPIATTTPATAVTTTGATLNATINPSNAATTYHFDYGTDAGTYGSRVPSSDGAVGSDGINHAISETLTGLAPNTTYHYRVAAVSPSGTTYGEDVAFTVGASPPTVSSSTATDVTETTATFLGTVNPLNAATTFHVEYGTQAGSYDQRTPVVDATVGSDAADHQVYAPVTGLQPATTYHYKLVATSAKGSADGVAGSFTTAATPLTPAPPVTIPVGTAPLPPPAPAQPVPTLGATAVGRAVSGTILVRLPGSSKYVELSPRTPIGSGATVDARRGTLELTTALDRAGHTQTARFRGAQFRVALSRAHAGMVDIHLTGAASGCPRRSARARASKAKPQRPSLWSKDDKGRYRTHGRNSVATVRGTEWTTTETCAGTVTRVTSGSVTVLDRRSGKRQVVRAGRSYTARS